MVVSNATSGKEALWLVIVPRDGCVAKFKTSSWATPEESPGYSVPSRWNARSKTTAYNIATVCSRR
jgi:hypothetical protein